MKEQHLTSVSNQLIALAFEKGPGLLLALITLLLGWWGINILTRVLKKTMMRSKNANEELTIFITKLLNILFKVMLFISVASMIGIATTSFVALLGAAGLAVGLAMQGSLANFAGGVLIILFRPFKAGDFIEGNGGTGTVTNIDILHTTLLTPDNKVIIIPNGQLSNNSVTNFSREDKRRVDFNIGIAYESDIKTARKIVLETVSSDPRVLKTPEPVSFLTSLDDSSMKLSTRVWVQTSDYWGVFFDNLEKIKEAFDRNNISIPFPQRDIHMKQ